MSETASDVARLTARVTALEELFTHLQQTVKDLDLVVTEQYRKIDMLEVQSGGLARKLSILSSMEPENRTLEEDKPPHY